MVTGFLSNVYEMASAPAGARRRDSLRVLDYGMGMVLACPWWGLTTKQMFTDLVLNQIGTSQGHFIFVSLTSNFAFITVHFQLLRPPSLYSDIV